MSAVSSNIYTTALPDRWVHNTLAYDAMRVITDQASGIMGRHLYSGDGAAKYSDLLRATRYADHVLHETRLIQAHATEIARKCALYERFIIIGPGTGRSFEQKEQVLLDSALRMPHCKIQEVVIVDLSEEFASTACQSLNTSQKIKPFLINKHVTDFRDPALITPDQSAAVIAVGGINIELDRAPDTHFPARQMVTHLQHYAKLAGIGGAFILGYDTCDNEDYLNTIYNDTRNLAFIHNPLHRLGIGDAFTSAARFLPRSSCVASYWIANKDTQILMPATNNNMNNERYSITTHKEEHSIALVSVKPDPAAFSHVLTAAGFRVENTYSNGTGDLYRVLQAMTCDNG